jgi:hypothetical protein
MAYHLRNRVARAQRLEKWLSSFNRSFGADTLHCGQVRDLNQAITISSQFTLNLEVGQTELDLLEKAGHALIVGLPSAKDNPLLAEDLAGELARMCRQADRQVRKKAKSHSTAISPNPA